MNASRPTDAVSVSGTHAGTASAAQRAGLLARHPLVFFFVLAYTGTWIVTLPVALSQDGAAVLPFRIPPLWVGVLIIVGNFSGPTLAGLLMALATEGPAGVRRLLQRLILWRVPPRWYVFALLGVPALFLFGALVLPGALASFRFLPLETLLLYPLSYLFVLAVGGPLGEEPGWRGFALPHLQRAYGPLLGSLILGVLWTFWHLPMFWVPAWNNPPTVLNMALFLAGASVINIVMTWVFNNTSGSLLIAVLVHASVDAFLAPLAGMFPVPIVTTTLGGSLPILIGLGTLTALLLVVTRGRLSYGRTAVA
jgi:uncharacterized protein